MHTMSEVAAFMHGEMVRNASGPVAAEIVKANIADAHVHALTTWKAWVGNRRPWDHKPFLKKTYGEWTADIPGLHEYNFDLWSNMHYGYVGTRVGFSGTLLRSGAGIAQRAAGTSPAGYLSRVWDSGGSFLGALDDPQDQAAIQVGIGLWTTKGFGLALDDVTEAVRAAAPSLNTRRIA